MYRLSCPSRVVVPRYIYYYYVDTRSRKWRHSFLSTLLTASPFLPQKCLYQHPMVVLQYSVLQQRGNDNGLIRRLGWRTKDMLHIFPFSGWRRKDISISFLFSAGEGKICSISFLLSEFQLPGTTVILFSAFHPVRQGRKIIEKIYAIIFQSNERAAAS